MNTASVLSLLGTWWWVLPIIVLLVSFKLVLRIFGIVMIPNDAIGIVNKKFALFGTRSLPDGALIAMHGEAGIQADTLAPGVHFWLWPWQYDVTRQKFLTIKEDCIATVESRDGKPLTNGRVLAKKVECNSFQDARAFLTNGGERGPQITVIPPGTYRINTSLFTLTAAKVLEIADNMVGVVTTKEGRPLATGEIAGGEVAGHNMFQDGQTFLDNNGLKGLQEQVILAGRYFINPLFATVEQQPMTQVPIAHAGVVIAFVGVAGKDVSGDDFKHGNLVSKGEKGVWAEPLDPGKYPINPFTHRVECVPTANVVLNWATGKTEAHKLDANLSTITVRSSDGFTFNLDVSQIIHIPRNKAPMVIARFGSVANLVTQVLEPTIGNYFRNAAQGSDVIEFLKQRTQRQKEAKDAIASALGEYNVGAVDTLIGDITPPAELMKTLTDRKIADQQRVTYETQRAAQDERQKLEQATALAATQARVVDAERQVAIAGYTADAAIKKAEGDSKSKTINAEADAKVLTMVGRAEGEKITAVGKAEALVIQQKTEAMDKGNFALVEVARALAGAGIPLVPQIVAGGGANGGGSLVDVLIANMIRDNLNKAAEVPAKKPPTKPEPAPAPAAK